MGPARNDHASFRGGADMIHLFHTATIDGEQFQAFVTSGGVSLIHRCRHEPGSQDAPIGNCTTIEKMDSEWQVVKYGNQSRIRLGCLSEKGVRELAREFGIPCGPDADSRDATKTFCTSPTFNVLQNWLNSHPRLAKEFTGGPYLLAWEKYRTSTFKQKASRTKTRSST